LKFTGASCTIRDFTVDGNAATYTGNGIGLSALNCIVSGMTIKNTEENQIGHKSTAVLASSMLFGETSRWI